MHDSHLGPRETKPELPQEDGQGEMMLLKAVLARYHNMSRSEREALAPTFAKLLPGLEKVEEQTEPGSPSRSSTVRAQQNSLMVRELSGCKSFCHGPWEILVHKKTIVLGQPSAAPIDMGSPGPCRLRMLWFVWRTIAIAKPAGGMTDYTPSQLPGFFSHAAHQDDSQGSPGTYKLRQQRESMDG